MFEAILAAIKRLLGIGEGDDFYSVCAVCSGAFPLSTPLVKTIPTPVGLQPFWAAFGACTACFVFKKIMHWRKNTLRIPSDVAATHILAIPFALAFHLLFVWLSTRYGTTRQVVAINWIMYTWFFMASTLLFTGYQLGIYERAGVWALFKKINLGSLGAGVVGLSVIAFWYFSMLPGKPH